MEREFLWTTPPDFLVIRLLEFLANCDGLGWWRMRQVSREWRERVDGWLLELDLNQFFLDDPFLVTRMRNRSFPSKVIKHFLRQNSQNRTASVLLNGDDALSDVPRPLIVFSNLRSLKLNSCSSCWTLKLKRPFRLNMKFLRGLRSLVIPQEVELCPSAFHGLKSLTVLPGYLGVKFNDDSLKRVADFAAPSLTYLSLPQCTMDVAFLLQLRRFRRLVRLDMKHQSQFFNVPLKHKFEKHVRLFLWAIWPLSELQRIRIPDLLDEDSFSRYNEGAWEEEWRKMIEAQDPGTGPSYLKGGVVLSPNDEEFLQS